MNKNIKAGADIHAGDGGYSLGTQEAYDEFAKMRNKSLTKNMNTLHLNKTELQEILEFVNKYPDVHMATLNWDSSSGIGKILTAEVRTRINNDYVAVVKTITDQTSW